MARQQSIFALVDGNAPPDESKGLKFSYDPENLESDIHITFPSGRRTLPPSKLAELGILFLALADTTEAVNSRELLQGFQLPAPFFMHLDLLASRVARQLVGALIKTYPAIKQDYGENKKKRQEFETALANKITATLRENV